MAKKHDEKQKMAENAAENGETSAASEEVAEGELPAVGEPAEEPKKEPSELEKAQALAEDYKRKWYAVAAEYDNYRKRTSAQASQAYSEGKTEAIIKLLPVADTFGYALDSVKDEAARAGIDKIIKNFNAILNSLGVTEAVINPGDKFDESIAEAVMNVPCGDGEEPNTVKLVMRKGYKLGDKVIRFAQVSVTV